TAALIPLSGRDAGAPDRRHHQATAGARAIPSAKVPGRPAEPRVAGTFVPHRPPTLPPPLARTTRAAGRQRPTRRQPLSLLPISASARVSAVASSSKANSRLRWLRLPRRASTCHRPSLPGQRYTSRRAGLATRPFHQFLRRSTQVLERMLEA